MFSALDISTSGLMAQRTRLNTISGNIANMSSQRNENGELKPFQPRFVVMETDPNLTTADGAAGVKVRSIEVEEGEPLHKYDPNNPLAIKEGKWAGYVAYPDVDMNIEFVDALEATRAYEANVGIIEVTKSLGAQTLRIVG
jgi:flagellar basal-body rod protein FlgC